MEKAEENMQNGKLLFDLDVEILNGEKSDFFNCASLTSRYMKYSTRLSIIRTVHYYGYVTVFALRTALQ
jgi:hypothetical protein